MDHNNHTNLSTDLANAKSGVVAAAAALTSIADKGDSTALDDAIVEVHFGCGALRDVERRIQWQSWSVKPF